jgi:MFS family permease
MLRASIGRFVLTAAIAALLAARLLPIGALFVAAAALGVVGALFTPARQSALPGLVADDDLEAGNAIMQVTAELAGVVGPVLAGLIVAAAGTAAAFAADAVAYGIAAVSVLGLPRGDAAPQERGGLLAGVRDGLGSAWSDVPLRAVVAVIAAINFTAAGPLDVGLAVLARNRWGGAWSFGLILGAFAAGAVLGAVAIGASPRRPRVGPLMIGLCVWLGVGMAALGVAGLVAAVVDALLMGVGVGVVGVVGVAWIQRRTPAARLGRVMALVTLSGVALAPLSYAIAGPLVALSPPLLFAAAGALMLAIGAACAASREVRTV